MAYLKSLIEYLIETLHALHQLLEVVYAKAYVAMNTQVHERHSEKCRIANTNKTNNVLSRAMITGH